MAFWGCGFDSIEVPKSANSIGQSAFEGCSNLNYVDIESVTSIGNYAFEGCSRLTEISIPASVTSIGKSTFWGCRSLTQISIPASVTSIGKSAFWGCSSLTQINIPDGSQLTSIGKRAFEGCSSLAQISIPASVTSIGEWAFRYCSNLKFADFLGTNEPNYGKNIFVESSVKTVDVPWDYNGNTFCSLPVTKNLSLRDFSKDWFVHVGVQALELMQYMESHDINSLTEAQIQRLLNNLNHVLGQVKKDKNGNLYLSGKWQGRDNTILHDDIVRLQELKNDLEIESQLRELLNYIKSHDINSLTEEQQQRLLNNLNHVLNKVGEDENGNLHLSGKWQGRDNTILHDDIVRLQELKNDLEIESQLRELLNYIKSDDDNKESDYNESDNINSLTEEQIQRLLNNLNHLLNQAEKDKNGNLYLKAKWRGGTITILRDISKLQKLKKDLEGRIV